MAFILNDAGTPESVYGTTSSLPAAAPEGGMDLSGWLALQQQFLLNAGSGASPADLASILGQSGQNSSDVLRMGEARREFLMLQSKINIETQSDNFVKDSITGK